MKFVVRLFLFGVFVLGFAWSHVSMATSDTAETGISKNQKKLSKTVGQQRGTASACNNMVYGWVDTCEEKQKKNKAFCPTAEQLCTQPGRQPADLNACIAEEKKFITLNPICCHFCDGD